jgi:hypothetical protein
MAEIKKQDTAKKYRFHPLLVFRLFLIQIV